MSSADKVSKSICTRVEALRRRVRSGDFMSDDLLDECWEARGEIFGDVVHRTLIHTLAWEIYDARGEYERAFDRLRADGVVDEGIALIEKEVRDPDFFREREFSGVLKIDERRARYNIWRQRVVGALAWGFAGYRLQAPEHGGRLYLAQSFIAGCLIPSGFKCSDTLSRLHFFLGHLHESNDYIAKAERENSCPSRSAQRERKSDWGQGPTAPKFQRSGRLRYIVSANSS